MGALFSFRGRLARGPFWGRLGLVALTAALVAALGITAAGAFLSDAVMAALPLALAPFAIAAVSLGARRLRDRGRPGWTVAPLWGGPPLLIGAGMTPEAPEGAAAVAAAALLLGGLALGLWSLAELLRPGAPRS